MKRQHSSTYSMECLVQIRYFIHKLASISHQWWGSTDHGSLCLMIHIHFFYLVQIHQQLSYVEIFHLCTLLNLIGGLCGTLHNDFNGTYMTCCQLWKELNVITSLFQNSLGFRTIPFSFGFLIQRFSWRSRCFCSFMYFLRNMQFAGY